MTRQELTDRLLGSSVYTGTTQDFRVRLSNLAESLGIDGLELYRSWRELSDSYQQMDMGLTWTEFESCQRQAQLL